MRWISLFLLTTSAGWALDLSKAVVDAPAGSKAAQVLIEEIEKRSWLRLPAGSSGAVKITLARGSGPAEGYTLKTTSTGVTVSGNDTRGLLFGVGHLLRKLEMSRGKITLPEDLNLSTAPETKMRGHQLGYRPKTNSYDAWSLPMWDQYIRELALWGTNAIELLPPRTDDADDSPHFPKPQMEMMIAMSQVCKDYDIDVWIWYPALDEDYSKPETVAFALKEWGEVFAKLPRVDNILVPGGDPGHTDPKYLMPLLEKQAANLRKYHPKAGLWVAPQGFNLEWADRFWQMVRAEPAWLTGLVHGPQLRSTVPEFRKMTPARYPVRLYPDITHTRYAQNPVPDWDSAWHFTEAREVINPRPRDVAKVYAYQKPHTVGFITYSEGCNDDVNKFLWSALGWDSKRPVADALRDYARFFIGAHLAEGFAQGLLSLEQNWQGPVITNRNILTTLEQFQSMERQTKPEDLRNWRFQQALYRAYYDGWVYERALFEAAQEQRALRSLHDLDRAEAILKEHYSSPLRQRVFELGEALFQSIRMQLTVFPHQAISYDRGASLEGIDYPLNNRYWLLAQIAEIRKLPTLKERDAKVEEIVNRDNPGPGGFYDDLGNLTRQPHLLPGVGFDKDPGLLATRVVNTLNVPPHAPELYAAMHKSLWDYVECQFDSTVQLRYEDLDPKAQYKVKVAYAHDARAVKWPTRLVADGKYEVHKMMIKPAEPVEFPVPQAATADGVLELEWQNPTTVTDAGRGCHVQEVWLMRVAK